jgi:hypothetical protein
VLRKVKFCENHLPFPYITLQMPLQTPRHLTKSGSVSQHQGHHQGHALSRSAQCQTDQYKTVQRHSAHSAHHAYDAHHAQHISTNKSPLLDGGLEITATQKAKYTDALDMSKELSGGIGGDAYHCLMRCNEFTCKY